MSRNSYPIRVFLFAMAASASFLSACATAGGSKPATVITSPPSGATYREGDDIAIQSTSADQSGITRVELVVDGAAVRSDAPPSPQTNFSIIQTWKATPGTHTIIVRAYNAAGAASDPAAISVTVTPSGAPGRAATPSLIPAGTSAPTIAASPTSVGCTNNSAFIADVTIPDGTVMAAGQTFDKTWRLSNNGSCAWGAGYQFVFTGIGEAMTSNTVVNVPATAPGATVDIKVPMTAPAASGAHSGAWRMRNPTGAFFGQTYTVKISVPGAPPPNPTNTTVPPTVATCSGTPSIASFTSTATVITAGGSATLNWGLVSNAESVEITPDIGGVATPGSVNVSPTATTTYTMTAVCGANSKTAQVTITVTAAPFAVTGVSASVTPPTYTGSCPGNFSFTGSITTNGAGTVTYRWEGSAGTSSTQSLNFGSAGTQAVGISWTVSVTGTHSQRLHILTPNDLLSSPMNLTNSCTP